jgi:hypothetical protein
VLFQHTDTNVLRVFWIPKDQSWAADSQLDEDNEIGAFEEYVETQIDKALEPGERYVPIAEFSRSTHTLLPCPACGRLLQWQNTGVSQQA